MPTPKDPSSYPPVFETLVRIIGGGVKDTYDAVYPDLQTMRHQRIIFYGYRRALQRRYDYLVRQKAIEESAIMQQEASELKELLDMARRIKARANDSTFTLTFVNSISKASDDPLNALMYIAVDPAEPGSETTAIATIEQGEITSIENSPAADRQLAPSDLVQQPVDTAALLGIEEPPLEEVEETPKEKLDPDSPAAGRAKQLRIAFETLSRKGEKMSDAESKKLSEITLELMDLDPEFIAPGVTQDMAEIDKNIGKL